MDIVKNIQKLKNIHPDESYARNSKKEILSLCAQKGADVRYAWKYALRGLQFVSSIALAALLVAFIAGIISVKNVSPVKLSNFDPAGLKAEAEAIDMQINLTDVTYNEPHLNITESTPNMAIGGNKSNKNKASAQNYKKERQGSPAPISITIDKALDELSK